MSFEIGSAAILHAANETIYIYIYICVCVCLRHAIRRQRTVRRVVYDDDDDDVTFCLLPLIMQAVRREACIYI